MKKLKPIIDYKNLRLNNINTPEYRHVLMLLFWVGYAFVFPFLERGLKLEYNIVYSPIDDYIPFCEIFVIPYYFWFVFLIGMIAYSFFFNIDSFKMLMKYIMVTNIITMLIYIIYPTAQELRPTKFERDNIFVDIVKALYGFDTNTNVCPSLHVINSFAVLCTAWKDKTFKSFAWRCFFVVSTVLITLSTVFLKQHSVIDVALAIVLCAVCYPFVFDFERLSEKIGGVKKILKQ